LSYLASTHLTDFGRQGISCQSDHLIFSLVLFCYVGWNAEGPTTNPSFCYTTSYGLVKNTQLNKGLKECRFNFNKQIGNIMLVADVEQAFSLRSKETRLWVRLTYQSRERLLQRTRQLGERMVQWTNFNKCKVHT
jgi:hypothetical protein